jgi:hypothetical protein
MGPPVRARHPRQRPIAQLILSSVEVSVDQGKEVREARPVTWVNYIATSGPLSTLRPPSSLMASRY